MPERLLVRRPNGTVISMTRPAFELHRPQGWREVESDGVNPNARVLFFAAMGGGRRVRSEWPAQALKNCGWRTQLILGWPGGRYDDETVLIYHRPLAKEISQFLSIYRDAGCRIIVSEDDNLGCIPAANEHQATPEQLREHDEAVASADGLIVTTPALEDVYGPLAKQMWRCPNYLASWVSSPEFLATIPRPNDGRVRVGWAGQLAVHRQDIEWLRPAARAMVEGAVFSTVGDADVLRLLRVRGEAWGHQNDIETYYRLQGRVDVGIVPLDNGENRTFNAAKSWLKALEFVSLGVPVVATDLPEQRALLEDTDAGILVDDPAQMAEAVQSLVRDGVRRARMSRAALELGRSLVIDRHVDEWAAPLRAVVGGS